MMEALILFSHSLLTYLLNSILDIINNVNNLKSNDSNQKNGHFMKMGFGALYCCATNEESASAKNQSRKSRNSSKYESSDLDVASTSARSANDKLDPKVNMMASRTVKLLTDIGEFKSFEKDTLQDNELKKNLQIHGDILARLENPKAFQ